MRMMAMMLAVVFGSTAALAQDRPPPPGAKPAAAAKPATQAKPKAAPAKPKPQPIAVRMQACMDIDDGTKERLNCFDAIFPPAPKPKPPAVKGVTDCRFIKEEDERLTCYNKFAEKIPPLPRN